MYRREVVLRAMLPMGAVAYLIYHAFLADHEVTLLSLFLLPAGAAYLGGRWAVRRLDARLHELLGALGLVAMVLATWLSTPYLLLLVVFIGAMGLFLLPLFDTATRSDQELALPLPLARNLGGWLFVLLCVVGMSYPIGDSWQDSLWISATLAAWLYFVGVLVALALLGCGKRREGTWVGSTVSLVMILFLIALSVFGYPEGY